MHVVRLLAPGLEGEDGNKDIDFSSAGIAARWRAGYENTKAVIARTHGRTQWIRWKASSCTRRVVLKQWQLLQLEGRRTQSCSSWKEASAPAICWPPA